MNKTSAWWNWPSEWVVERAFWREVGTRTISGVLTLIFLGSPVVIYAMISGALKPEQGVPILIGAGMFIVVTLVYVIVLSIIRAIERRQIRKALSDNQALISWPSTEDIMHANPGELIGLLEKLSGDAREEVEESSKRAQRRALFATIGSVALTAAGAILPLLLG